MARFGRAQVSQGGSAHRGGARGHTSAIAGMLLAVSLGALLLVANELIDSWADGRLLAAWVALWTLAFAALAMLTPPLRQVCAYSAAFIEYGIALMKTRRC